MSELNRKWDRLSAEKRKLAIDEIIYYFESERNEKIGVVAAEQFLNFFLQTIGAEIYNKGINDSKEVLEKRMEEVKYDLDDLIDWQ